MRFRGSICLFLFTVCAWAEGEGAAHRLARLLDQGGFDPQACYRVHDLEITKEDLRVYLSSGYLILATKIDGVRPAALFTADTEGGDAEVLVIPPNRSERRSLATFTDSPNLDEHFQSALMLFTDGTGEKLERLIAEKEQEAAMSWRDAERGSTLSASATPILRNLYGSFGTRLIEGLLSPASRGMFFATINGRTQHNFDVLYDQSPSPRITLGQLNDRGGRTWFDTWVSFPARSARTPGKTVEQPVAFSDYRIEATLDPNLAFAAVTRAKVLIGAGTERAVPFLISSAMHVKEASIDGVPAEVFESQSLRSSLIRGGRDGVFLVVPKAPLTAGRTYEFEFRYDGDVIASPGNGIYFVGARGSWYPHAGIELANFDITYRWPRNLDLVSTGALSESHNDGEMAVARYRTSAPIRLAGFNLGKWDRRVVEKNGFHIEVCANANNDAHTGANDSAMRLEAMADEISAALAFMSSKFGPPPVSSLAVTPIPATFGQGFPGLIYLSSLSYLSTADRSARSHDKYMELLYSELMLAHETAHQWWGNLVIPAREEDDWLSEALANYSALLFLEHRDGPGVVESVLDGYRRDLTERGTTAHSVESAGPITWSTRLSSSQNPDAWRVITYEKGSWIMHMLRVRLGDEKFLAFLGELCRRYRMQEVSTEEFRNLAAEFLPPDSPDHHLEAFFDTWVYGTGIPALKLHYAVNGTKITGTVTQTGVGDDFSAWVPVRIVTAGGAASLRWVETGSDPASFSWTLPERPVRAALQAADALVTIQE